MDRSVTDLIARMNRIVLSEAFTQFTSYWYKLIKYLVVKAVLLVGLILEMFMCTSVGIVIHTPVERSTNIPAVRSSANCNKTNKWLQQQQQQ